MPWFVFFSHGSKNHINIRFEKQVNFTKNLIGWPTWGNEFKKNPTKTKNTQINICTGQRSWRGVTYSATNFIGGCRTEGQNMQILNFGFENRVYSK